MTHPGDLIRKARQEAKGLEGVALAEYVAQEALGRPYADLLPGERAGLDEQIERWREGGRGDDSA